MTIPSDTISKMQSLTSDNLTIVINLVDQLASSNPTDIFNALCEDGARNPMSEKEVASFVSNVRKERNASGN